MGVTSRIPVSTLNRYLRNVVEQGTLEQRVLTNQIMMRGNVMMNVAGDAYDWTVRFRRVGQFREHDVFQEVNVQPELTEVRVQEEFGRYIQTSIIDDEEMLINRSPDAIYNLVTTKMDSLGEDGKDEFHMEMHVGDGNGRRITGLNQLLPTAYGTVHGIDQTANPYWQHVLLDGAAGPNTNADTDRIERIQTGLIGANRGDSAGEPDFGITTTGIYLKIVNAHVTNERYKAGGMDISSKLEYISVSGVPIFYDKHAQAGVLRLLNSKKLKLAFRTAGMFKMEKKRPSNRQADALIQEMFPNFMVMEPRYNAVIMNFA